MNNAFDQRMQDINAFDELRSRHWFVKRHFGAERMKKFLRMDNVTNTMHIRIFLLSRTLPGGEVCQIWHKSLDEAFEESHHEQDRHTRHSCHEHPNFIQILMDGKY